MNKKRGFLSIVFLLFFLAIGLFYLPFPNKNADNGFSAVQVAEDIREIAKEPHSIKHPEARDRVRSYLSERLSALGALPMIFSYDSLPNKLGDTMDIANVYARFDPPSGADGSYVMLVAHLDSRYGLKVLEDTVYSFGAADDGYGLGVILESVRVAMQYHQQWKQGIKVLFTDSEECELDGMRNAFAFDKQLFANVELVINVEARGVKGPALLFEVTQPSSSLMQLYKNARIPYGYSLTSVVYDFLPNDTDFSVIKDTLPAFNFSVIDNMHYYHTDKDCFENISLRSLQHYGNQLSPIIKEFLCDDLYGQEQVLRQGNPSVFFTLPLLGLFVFSKESYVIWNAIALALLSLAFFRAICFQRFNPKKVLSGMGLVLLCAVGIAGIGELLAYLASLHVGTPFKWTGVLFVKYDWILILVCMLAVVVCGLSAFKRKEYLFSVLWVMAIVGAVLLFVIGENHFLMLPVLLASLGYLLQGLGKWGWWLSVLACGVIVLAGASFFYCLITALTIGLLGLVLMLVFLYVLVVRGLLKVW